MVCQARPSCTDGGISRERGREARFEKNRYRYLLHHTLSNFPFGGAYRSRRLPTMKEEVHVPDHFTVYTCAAHLVSAMTIVITIKIKNNTNYMHSADVRITHLESPEIQNLLIGYLLMIALFLPLPLSLSLFASLSSTNIISIKKTKYSSLSCAKRAPPQVRVSRAAVPEKKKKRKKKKTHPSSLPAHGGTEKRSERTGNSQIRCCLLFFQCTV